MNNSKKPNGIAVASAKLSRDLIVDTAPGQVDRLGVQGLSMRSLAQELGVEAMSLYRYVHGKEDLLEGIVASLMSDLTSQLDEAEEIIGRRSFKQLLTRCVASRRSIPRRSHSLQPVTQRHRGSGRPSERESGQHVSLGLDRKRLHRRPSRRCLSGVQQLSPRPAPSAVCSQRS